MFVNVREYYEDKAGEMKPGKKVSLKHSDSNPFCIVELTRAQGIMLSVEQYQALTGLIPAINAELRKKGVVLDGDKADEDEDESEEVSAKSSKSVHKTKKQSKKANIEATSDEDEEG